MAIGKKTGGRKKGVPNKITRELREVIKAFCDQAVPQLPQMLEDCWHGIEIEKQMPDGSTVVGRLNADPGKAAELTLKAMEFCVPKLGRTEVTGEDGGPIRIVKVDRDD
jgi:hypothetical protein